MHSLKLLSLDAEFEIDSQILRHIAGPDGAALVKATWTAQCLPKAGEWLDVKTATASSEALRQGSSVHPLQSGLLALCRMSSRLRTIG